MSKTIKVEQVGQLLHLERIGMNIDCPTFIGCSPMLGPNGAAMLLAADFAANAMKFLKLRECASIA